MLCCIKKFARNEFCVRISAVFIMIFVTYVLFVLLLVRCFADDCSYPYRRVGKGCYLIQKDHISGDDAFAKCLRRGAYLANFETLNEALLMKYELLKINSGVHYYVGGRNINRYKPSGDWRWIKKNGDTVKMTYFAFDKAEPNGSLSAPQDCMFFYAPRGYRFHNVWCAMGGDLGGYICEK